MFEILGFFCCLIIAKWKTFLKERSFSFTKWKAGIKSWSSWRWCKIWNIWNILSVFKACVAKWEAAREFNLREVLNSARNLKKSYLRSIQSTVNFGLSIDWTDWHGVVRTGQLHLNSLRYIRINQPTSHPPRYHHHTWPDICHFHTSCWHYHHTPPQAGPCPSSPSSSSWLTPPGWPWWQWRPGQWVSPVGSSWKPSVDCKPNQDSFQAGATVSWGHFWTVNNWRACARTVEQLVCWIGYLTWSCLF